MPSKAIKRKGLFILKVPISCKCEDANCESRARYREKHGTGSSVLQAVIVHIAFLNTVSHNSKQAHPGVNEGLAIFF